MTRRLRVAAGTTVLALAIGTGCSAGTDQSRTADVDPQASPRTSSPAPSPTGGAPTATPSAATASGTTSGTTSDTPGHSYEVPGPVSLPAYFDRDFSGGDLRLGQVRERERERTGGYTSYDLTYRSEKLRISGVLNVPTGRGPFPAVVLAHGYIDPDAYVSGQGMTRERNYLADAGYVTLHVDYRNHAGSDDQGDIFRTFRLGYAVDIINAVNALRATTRVPVDDDRVAIAGRSMGGGVVYQALEMAPGLVGAGVVFSSVASDEAENYRQYRGLAPFWADVETRRGAPAANPDFYDAVSADTYADRITEPVLINHGTADTTCPPRWAEHTNQALQDAGVDTTLKWYDGEGHEFGAQFDTAMTRTVRYLDNKLT
jgi:dipeptidyl aminopeptidase/acylaminoacyl peptidase